MLKPLCRWMLFGLMGWKSIVTEQLPDKCIICLAPHTSNWDFIIALLYSRSVGLKSNFLMKREWFVWPLGPLFRSIGGIPVWRDRHTRMTDILAESAVNADMFRLCVTPEGTRSANPDWRKGFYYIAEKAGLPILLYGVDYDSRTIYCVKTIVPDGNVDSQMSEIKLYFKDFKGRHPEKFTIGDIQN